MQEPTRHPDDATLFDLVEGTLDAAAAAPVREHLGRCAACAAFVSAARAAAPETTAAVVAMPDPAAHRMHLRLSQEWRARVASIAAAEALEDARIPAPHAAATIPDDDLVPLRPDPPRVVEPPARPRWSRRLVPLAGVAVLAGLAGTSVWLGDAPSGPGSGAESGGQAATPAMDDAAVPGASGEQGAATAGAPPPSGLEGAAEQQALDAATAPPPAADGAGGGSPGGVEGAIGGDTAAGSRGAMVEPDAGAAGAPGPPIGYDELVPTQCVAAFSEAQLVLPDGRIPLRIVDGPLGIYLVCG